MGVNILKNKSWFATPIIGVHLISHILKMRMKTIIKIGRFVAGDKINVYLRKPQIG